VRGHIAKKGENYYAVVSVWDPATAKRRRKWIGGFRRRKDAERAFTSTLQSLDKNTYVDPTKQTLTDFVTTEWLPAIKATVRHSTWDSYRRNLQNHVLPDLGEIRLAKLTPAQLNALYGRLLENGHKAGGKGLSPKTVRYIHTTVHRALRDAVRWGKLARNPAGLADPPSPRAAQGPEMKAWTAAEARAFLRHVERDRLHACYFLALTTGMRRGELLGLRWSDVDLDGARLSIRQTLVSVGYEMRFSQPKTDRSRRSLSLDPATVTALQGHRESQQAERHAWGPAWSDSGLVFSREDGTLLHPQLLTDAFDRHVKTSGLPRIRLHDLRHTYATLALDSGMKPWDLSDRLGHSSVAFTLNIYRHAIKPTQDEAAAAAAAFILGPPKTTP
jgi:integrase